MYKLTYADLVWNRACGDDPLRSLPGDRALADLLKAHGLAMNGGVLHASECLTDDEILNAAAAYRYFGFDAVAQLLSRAKAMLSTNADLGAVERRLDAEYVEAIPADDAIAIRFQQDLKTNPDVYATLRAVDQTI